MKPDGAVEEPSSAQIESGRPCDVGVTAHCGIRAELRTAGLTCCSPTNDLTTYFFRSSALGVSSATSLNTFKTLGIG